MSNNFLRKSMVITTVILLFGTTFAVGFIPRINIKTVDEEQKTEIDTIKNNIISLRQTQEMIRYQKAIVIDIQDRYISSQINGVIPVTLSDLECGSCIEPMLKGYECLIVYSENNNLRAQASNILRERNYIVYELIENLPSEDFPIAYQSFNLSIEPINEEYTEIQIIGSAAKVSSYNRAGQIKRLYGEAFSYGENPEESANKFLQSNSYLFGVDPADLKDQYLQPIMYLQDTDEYKFTGVNYNQYKEGIPVFRSKIILLVKNVEGYPLVHASVDLHDLSGWTPDVEISNLNPELGVNNALVRSPDLVYFTQSELVIWAGINDMIVEPTLAYSFIGDNRYQTSDITPEKYLFITDAVSGDILYVENLIRFIDVTGNVQGKATQGKAADFCEDESAEDLMWARVNIGSTVAYTDANGDFTITNSGSSPVTVQSGLWGQWFKVTNQAGANTVLSLSVTPPGPANFMHNNLNNDEYKRAEVNGYYQANIVRDFTLVYNPSYPGLQQSEFPVKVNDNTGYCPGNAWYDGSSITFCRADSGYPNTAWSSIIHHEYGHHLVAMAGSGQGQYGEGMGDVMGLLILDDPGSGWGFYGDCGTSLRHAVNTIQYPCSGEIHYCGQLLSGCVWETRNELVVTNPTTYIDIISNLAINAMLLHTGDMIAPSITIDYLTLDDDNGNIYDGTPHYWEIATGFGEHNMDAPVLNLLSFDFPNGLPEIISPGGGTTVRVIVNGVAGTPEPGTGALHIDDGSGWVEIPMTEITSNIYDAVFPPGICQESVSFYFSAETTNGQTQLSPPGAPNEWYNAVFAYNMTVIISDNFENDLGWTVVNDPYLTDGAWERGVPIGGGDRGDPPSDYDGSGKCYLTDNEDGNSDVDDGITWLISPSIDLSGSDNAKVDYGLWYTNNNGNDPNNDLFKVYVSDDNGANWNLVETIGPVTTSGWAVKTFMVEDFVSLTSQVKVRFEASDLNDGSVVEAGIDAFRVAVFDCVGSNLPPFLSNEIPSDGSTDVPITTTSLTVTINDQEGDSFNWSIETSPHIGNTSGTGDYNGTKTCSVSGLSFNTIYTWFVNATDTGSSIWSREIYIFTTESTPNNPPNIPNNPNPPDGAVDIDVNADLSWSCSDPDGDNLTYDVYFEENDPTPDELVSNNQTGTTYNPATMNYNTHYYWQIVGWDPYGAYNSSPVWDFTTGSEPNDPPNPPGNPNPEDDATDVDLEADLSWTCSDPDGDDLVYDVYFEANDPNPNVLVSDDQVETTFDPGIMSYVTEYYWKIVAKDEHGASTSGPVWHFTTKDNTPPEEPTIMGPNGGKPNTAYDFTFNTSDSDGHDVKYHIDWGDSDSENTSYYPSGTDVTLSHTWSDKGTYTITAYAEDEFGAESDLSNPFYITIDKSKAINTPFLNFLQSHPNLFPLLQRLLQRLELQ